MTNGIQSIDVYQLGAVKGKKMKMPVALVDTGSPNQNPDFQSASSAISVADFLDNVKTIPIANEIFSDDVAQRLIVNRTQGSLSQSLVYALPEDVTEIPVFYVSDDNDLEIALSNNPRKEKYNVLKNYILNQIGNEIITMSDGEKVIVDGSDAQHIAHRAGSQKTAKISKIKELVEKAVYYAYDDNAEHNKFDEFKYYYAKVVFKEEEYNAFLNVGKGKNDSKYHLYDITEKIRDNAHRLNGVGRLREFRPGNIVSADMISESPENVNTQIESENYALPENINIENASDDRAKAAKEIANRTLGKKVYTKADAADTVNEILEKTLASGDMSSEYIGKLSGKSKNAVINFLYEQMNTAPEGARAGLALAAADYILPNKRRKNKTVFDFCFFLALLLCFVYNESNKD